MIRRQSVAGNVDRRPARSRSGRESVVAGARPGIPDTSCHNTDVTQTQVSAKSKSASVWIPPALLVVMVAWEAMRESGRLAIGDVFWHLRTGDLILSNGPPRRDPFSWTAAGERWRPNAWLGDALWAVVRAVAGPPGVSLLAGAAVLAVALLLYRASRRGGAGPWASVAASAISVLFMAPFIDPRPLLLGFVLLPIALGLVSQYRAGRRGALIRLGLLITVWSNLHGAFVVAVGIIGLIAIGWAIDRRTLVRPSLLAATTVVAGLANPYGVFSYLQAVYNRAESGSIDEWQPLAVDDGRGILLAIFIVLTAAALWRSSTGRETRGDESDSAVWANILPIAVLMVATFWSIRMGSFLLIVAAPTVACGFSGIIAARVRAWASDRVVPLVGGLALAGVMLAVQEVPELSRAREPVPRFSDPIVAAIPSNCRLLNEYDLGGFIIDRRWPDVLVSQDGRADLYGSAELRLQESWLNTSDIATIEAAGIRCVLADADRPLAAALVRSPGWKQTAESSELVLLVKR